MTHWGILLVTLFTLHHIVYGEYLLTLDRLQTCHSEDVCRYLTHFLSDYREKKNFQLRLIKETQCGQGPPKAFLRDDPPEERRCVTPEGIEGTCIDIESCDTLKDLLNPPVSKKHRNYVNSHRCDDTNENMVCCINCSAILGPPHPKTGCCGRDKSGEAPNPDVPVTSIYQYPWMVLIEYEDFSTGEKTFKCGGTLISSKYVLTAAQCFFKQPCSHYVPTTVQMGDYDLSVKGPDCVDVGGNRVCTDGAIRVPIEAIFAYHSYRRTALFDIALVRLQYNVPYTDFVRPICLPSSDVQEDEPQTFYVTGFGQTDENLSMSNNKKLHVDVPFAPLEECKKMYDDNTEWEGIICAGGIEGRGACTGDAGGPLMSYNGFYELVGLVSFGRNLSCGIENIPDGFTKVFYFLPWIRSLIKP